MFSMYYEKTLHWKKHFFQELSELLSYTVRTRESRKVSPVVYSYRYPITINNGTRPFSHATELGSDEPACLYRRACHHLLCTALRVAAGFKARFTGGDWPAKLVASLLFGCSANTFSRALFWCVEKQDKALPSICSDSTGLSWLRIWPRANSCFLSWSSKNRNCSDSSCCWRIWAIRFLSASINLWCSSFLRISALYLF